MALADNRPWQWSYGIRHFTCLVIFLSLLSTAVVAMAEEVVRHRLSFPENRQQLFLVRSEFPVTAAMTELMMPNWTPGSYQIRNFAANIDRISAASENGRTLTLEKTAKDRWRVNTNEVETLVVSYEVSTPKLSVQTSWASNAFSLINGASVFLYTTPSREFPQVLNIVKSTDRGETYTGLPNFTKSDYRAENYDELVDNPVAIASAPSYRFNLNGQDYVLVNVGENEFWDGEKAARDVKKIVAGTQSFWGINPLERPYWFLNFIVGSSGGLEHDHSTVMMAGHRQMRDRQDYIKWLGLVAHEFFHVWNVRKMRPVELASYDYQNEQYTRQLWLAEGLSSYFDNLIMSRTGLINPDEYLTLLAKDIHRLETTPGRLIRPVDEASFDAWIRQYQSNPNSLNSTISYYTKGAIIGFVLDTFLRQQSKGRHDLDEVMRTMYSLYSDRPYGPDAFESVVADVGGPEAAEFLKSLLTTTVEPKVDAALDWYGLQLIRGATSEPGDENSLPLESGFGAVWDKDKRGLVVKTVLAGSGGAIAGLLPGDEILAAGNDRLTVDTLKSVMSSFQPGDEATLLVSRRNRIISLKVRLDTAIPEKFFIAKKSDFRKTHVKRLESLLGQR